ncbi:MAG: hypothetical protein GY779_09495 [Gammaproteobacteria bacterium]|nr:hypothetical protein [Gammaproteobacteria bacterium]
MTKKPINMRTLHTLLASLLIIISAQVEAADSETWHYGLDDVGNITSRGTDPLPANATHSYIYDGLYRLTDETNPNNTDQYGYDANSNRTGFTRDGSATTYQIDANSNRLDQVGSDPRTYDNIGNTKTDRNGTRAFTYNKAGRIAEVHENGTLLASYTYNAQGQRVIKTTPMGTTYYLYDTGGQLLGEYDATGAPIKEYVHLEGVPIAQVDNTSITYLHTDHLATPRKATNEAGQVVWQWDSEAFGNALPQSSGVEVNLRFPGQYYDQETGLYYNYFRTYDPSTGRYLESDPIGLGGGLNTYAYVGGNPLSYSDPLGLCPAGGLICVGGPIVISAAARAIISRLGTQAAIAGGLGMGADAWDGDVPDDRYGGYDPVDEADGLDVADNPSGLETCEEIREAITALENRLRGRRENADDYGGADPGHAQRIQRIINAIARLKEMLKNCCEN